MKDLLKKSLLLVVSGLTLVSCGEKPSVDPSVNPSVQPSDNPSEEAVVPGDLSLEDYKAYMLYDLQSVISGIGVDKLDASVRQAVEAKHKAGVEAIGSASDLLGVDAAFKNAKSEIANCIPLANGIHTFVGKTNEEKTEILGALEAYAVRNGITGISLFENGGYVMYNDRVTLGTENYIPGYGFGNLAEGSLKAPLATEVNPAWQMYWHSINASDPGSINALNNKGSEVSDLYGYIGGSYFTTFMNKTKDGYDWVPELAKEKPQPVNGDVNSATKWRFEVRTGSELKYTTNSKLADRKAFNNREVAPEDYLTPYKLLLTKKNGYLRGSEMAGKKTDAIVGAKAYYDASAGGYTDEAWKKVGLEIVEENGKTYFQYEFVNPVNQFYSMYYISGNLYQPIPQSFLDLVTPENYMGYNKDKTQSPVDNSLSLGAYALEAWNAGQEIVFKKNPNYVYADTKYQMAGVHVNILTAASEDPEAGFKEFIAENTDASGIPQTKLDEYKNDPRTRHTTGDSNFKLNVNALNSKDWEYMFGENGVVAQTPKDKYWEVEPALSNKHFVKALSLSIDRKTFAEARGSIASVDYFSSNYMSDPENGISYANTKAHKDAVAGLLADTDGCGFNLEEARNYFRIALKELEAEGVYTPGTKENPKVIELECAWMYPQHEDAYHKEIKQYLETAFNDESVSGGKYKLDVKFWVGNDWSDVYYTKLMVGQYDLGFGSISGNALNPLDFMSVLSSDQTISGNFTLNWGTNTNDPLADILVYDGQRWSYDALWTAGNSTAIVVDGKNCEAASAELISNEVQADGSAVAVIEVTNLQPKVVNVEIGDVKMCWYADPEHYKETSLIEASEVKTEGTVSTITVKVSKELVDAYPGDIGFDIYYSAKAVEGDQVIDKLISVYSEYPMPEAPAEK